MKRYTAAERIEYYKNQVVFLEKENANQLNQITELMKENNRLRCQINVLENKLKNKTEKEND